MWHIRLRIQHYHCSSSGSCCGADLIPGLGISTCYECSQKRKKKKDGVELATLLDIEYFYSFEICCFLLFGKYMQAAFSVQRVCYLDSELELVFAQIGRDTVSGYILSLMTHWKEPEQPLESQLRFKSQLWNFLARGPSCSSFQLHFAHL